MNKQRHNQIVMKGMKIYSMYGLSFMNFYNFKNGFNKKINGIKLTIFKFMDGVNI